VRGRKDPNPIYYNWLRVLAGVGGDRYNDIEMMWERSAICCMSPWFVPFQAVFGHDADKRDSGVTRRNEVPAVPAAVEDQIWQ
jgi:hypothetical protein